MGRINEYHNPASFDSFPAKSPNFIDSTTLFGATFATTMAFRPLARCRHVRHTIATEPKAACRWMASTVMGKGLIVLKINRKAQLLGKQSENPVFGEFAG